MQCPHIIKVQYQNISAANPYVRAAVKFPAHLAVIGCSSIFRRISDTPPNLRVGSASFRCRLILRIMPWEKRAHSRFISGLHTPHGMIRFMG